MRGVLFELREVTYSRGGRRVLDSIGAEIVEGATAVVGPSGSGKSTLLRLLNRLAEPERGTISYRERLLSEYDPLALRRDVALVPQLPALLDGTVEANIRYAAGLACREPELQRCLRLAGLDPDFGGRDVSSSRSASSSGRCWHGQSPSSRVSYSSTSRPRRWTESPATRSRQRLAACAMSWRSR